ncbi:hypothetical protein K470DRAFT_258409 [Piedraia hortae CBS 480.64]|uniref:Uncharacterized protein n=1 Tax=Piedraia hortae CBS 480.64 TaxID=1314780 RepID=A0A6A7BXD9_9PEZI|nr:hypothetical protein K470DRAFT_258409 [Piedraia hortae CBS 480.64]
MFKETAILSPPPSPRIILRASLPIRKRELSLEDEMNPSPTNKKRGLPQGEVDSPPSKKRKVLKDLTNCPPPAKRVKSLESSPPSTKRVQVLERDSPKRFKGVSGRSTRNRMAMRDAHSKREHTRFFLKFTRKPTGQFGVVAYSVPFVPRGRG